MSIQSYTNVRLITYEFLTYVINTIPDAEFVRRIRAISFDWLPAGGNEESKITGVYYLREFIKETQSYSPEELSLQLAIEWTLIFRGIRPSCGPPPARASAYRIYDIAFLNKIYQRTGLKLINNHFDPDYLGVQLAFLYEFVRQEYLYRKQKDFSQAIHLVNQQRYFILNYLDWIPDFHNRALEYMTLPFYKGVLSLLVEFLNEELLWLQDVVSTG